MKNLKEDLKKICVSKWFRVSIKVLALIIIISLSFSLGELVGFKKSGFVEDWGRGYGKNFRNDRFEGILGMMGGGMMRGYFNSFQNLRGGMMVSSHGIYGQVISNDGSSLMIALGNNVEDKILVSSTTLLRNETGNVQLSDIKVGESVAIVGNPNNSGEIEARFIRIINLDNGINTNNSEQANPVNK